MTDNTRSRPSLKEFDAYADRNGQDLGAESPLDVGIPARTQAALKRNPDGEAEAARLASGLPRQDAVEATEAETPAQNLRRISDPSTTATSPDGAAEEAIERATAAVGQDDGEEAPRHGK